MRNRISLLLLALCLLLTACGPASQPEPEPDPAPAVESSSAEEIPAPQEPAEPELPRRDREWIEDIEFLREEYKTKHADPFYFCSEEEFDWKMDQLISKVGGLSDSDIFYELEAIIHGMGDTHTTLWWDGYLPLCDRVFAVNILTLNGRLYLWNYLEGCDQFEPYLLHEIVGVNGVDSLYLMRRAAELYEPYNWHTEVEFPEYPTFFDWVGCDYKEGYTFQILNDDQEVESVEVPVITLSEGQSGTWVYPENCLPLACIRSGDQVVYCEGKDGGCIQWCMGELWSTGTTGVNVYRVGRQLEEHPDCGKVVIDLRRCPGGSGGLLPLLEVIRKGAQPLEGKQIYVLTGGATASAATKMIAFLKDEFGAVTVGEPTGQFTSFFSRSAERDSRPTVLPNSQIKVKISDEWRDAPELLGEMGIAPLLEEYYDEDGRLYAWETCIQPDVYVHMDIEDFRQGKDSVLEWVLAQ